MYEARHLLDLSSRGALRLSRVAWLAPVIEDWPVYAVAGAYVLLVAIAMPILGVGHLYYVRPLWWPLLWWHLSVGIVVAVVQIGNRRFSKWLCHRAPAGLLLWLPFTPVFHAFTSWKQGFFHWAPYVWDSRLHEVDVALHGGRPTWEWLAPILTPSMLVFVDWVYIMWFLVMMTALSAVLWIAESPLRRRFVLTKLLLWIVLGSVLAPIFASGGPCYYARLADVPDPYTPLWQLLDGSGVQAREIQGWLWSVMQEPWSWRPFTGISAMPSLHVAQATLVACFAWRSTQWSIRLAGLAYLALVQVGSVVLGWHYAIDGYVAIALTIGLWRVVGRV